MGKLKLENYKEEIIKLYEDGTSVKDISIKYKCYSQPIYNLIKLNSSLIKRQPKPRLSQGNTDYFENIDSKIKAYMLGFIAADGALVKSTQNKNQPPSLTITIHRKDICILEKLKEEIGFEHEIKPIKRYHKKWKKFTDHVRIAIQNKKLSSDIMKYGIGYNKSLIMGNIIPNIPAQFRKSFILGYFDGDGSFCHYLTNSNKKGKKSEKKSLKKSLSFRATKDFIEGIIIEMNIKSFSISSRDSIPQLNMCSKNEVINFFHIYNDQPFYLQRKYNKFIEYFNLINYDPFN